VKMVVIHDLSTLSPEQVLVRIGNGEEIEEIDLTIVPARGTLLLTQATQKHGGWNNIPDEEMIPAIAAICQQSNPKITAEWLETKLTRPQLAGLTAVVQIQAYRYWKGGNQQTLKQEGEEKNP